MRFAETDIKSIVVFRALQLGDLLCSIPAFRALRLAYPEAHITLVGMPWMKMLVDRFPAYFDEFIWFPGYPGLPEQPVDIEKTIRFLKEMNNRNFDLAIQMQGNGSVVNPMVELFGAKYTAGFYRKEDYFPGDGFILYPSGIHEINRHLLLMHHLGISFTDENLEFPITQKDDKELESAQLAIEKGKYICVHPGSRGGWRQWPTRHFAAMAEECQQLGYQVVLTGTADEMEIVNQVAGHMKMKPVIAAGKTSLGAVAALLNNSAGLISNCTGVSHIASALKTKSIVISMDGEPERWGPLDITIHKTFDWTKSQNIEPIRQAVQHLFSKAS